MSTIGIVGFGNMGEAFGAGLISSMPEVGLNVYEPLESRSDVARSTYGATRIISIMAGKTVSWIGEAFGTDQVIRFMPSIAAQVKKSVVAFSPSAAAEPEFVAKAKLVAASVGRAVELPERLMSAFTGLSGSGIAYKFSFIHALARGGTKVGIGYTQSPDTILSTMMGAIDLLAPTGEHSVSLLTKVTSPAGTTVEGIQALENGGLTATVMEAVERAATRAAEFEN